MSKTIKGSRVQGSAKVSVYKDKMLTTGFLCPFSGACLPIEQRPHWFGCLRGLLGHFKHLANGRKYDL